MTEPDLSAFQRGFERAEDKTFAVMVVKSIQPDFSNIEDISTIIKAREDLKESKTDFLDSIQEIYKFVCGTSLNNRMDSQLLAAKLSIAEKK